MFGANTAELCGLILRAAMLYALGKIQSANRLNYTAPFKKHGYRSALGSFYSKTCVFSPF